MNRAQTFYETVFKVFIKVQDLGGLLYGWFPPKPAAESCTGALIQYESYVPSKTDGILIYFSSEDVANERAIIEETGGTIVKEKTMISPDTGYMAVFIDSEGNKNALFSSA